MDAKNVDVHPPELVPLPVADPRESLPAVGMSPLRASRGIRLVTLLLAVVPLLGFGAAFVSLWGYGFNWLYLALLLGMYFSTALGITVGYHRLFTHKSFETYPFLQFILGVLGSMAIQGPLFQWVALHRRHHQHTDTADDPHSPHTEGEGFLGLLRGIWHSHMGWLFRADPPDLARYVKDLHRSRLLVLVNSLFLVWAGLGFLLPATLGGLLSGTWTGVALGLIWGGLSRLFLVHHITWSVNSICHLWGQKTYSSKDESRDNVAVGVLAMGEGWHNTHHAFPTSARHGLMWWQIDVSYYVIRVLAWLHLVWNIRLPSKESQAALRSPPDG